jgi:hypothetical protein
MRFALTPRAYVAFAIVLTLLMPLGALQRAAAQTSNGNRRADNRRGTLSGIVRDARAQL